MSNCWGSAKYAFLLHDSGSNSVERVIVFATIENVRRLRRCNIWQMDGNFSMAPQNFTQLHVILGKEGDLTLPLVYAVLQRKTTTTYIAMLQAIQLKM